MVIAMYVTVNLCVLNGDVSKLVILWCLWFEWR